MGEWENRSVGSGSVRRGSGRSGDWENERVGEWESEEWGVGE